MFKELNDLKCFIDMKNYISPWLELEDFNFEHFINISPVISINKEEILFQQGEKNTYVYIVRKGRVRIKTIDISGNERCVYIAEEGSLIGELSVLDKIPNFASAQAIVNTSLYKIGENDFLKVLEENPLASFDIMRIISKKVRLLNSVIEYSSKSAINRIAIALISLCIKYGLKHSQGIKISIRFTHEELSILTSLNRVTVSKCFNELKCKGIIGVDSGYIIIQDVQNLKDIIQ